MYYVVSYCNFNLITTTTLSFLLYLGYVMYLAKLTHTAGVHMQLASAHTHFGKRPNTIMCILHNSNYCSTSP